MLLSTTEIYFDLQNLFEKRGPWVVGSNLYEEGRYCVKLTILKVRF